MEQVVFVVGGVLGGDIEEQGVRLNDKGLQYDKIKIKLLALRALKYCQLRLVKILEQYVITFTEVILQIQRNLSMPKICQIKRRNIRSYHMILMLTENFSNFSNQQIIRA